MKQLGYILVFAVGLAAGHFATHYYDVSHLGERRVAQAPAGADALRAAAK